MGGEGERGGSQGFCGRIIWFLEEMKEGSVITKYNERGGGEGGGAIGN